MGPHDVGRRPWPTATRCECDPVLATARWMDITTWLLVGLVAGALASALARGGGVGLRGDIVLGIAGAVVGGWTFHALGWQSPSTGVAGLIAVALAGAVIALALVVPAHLIGLWLASAVRSEQPLLRRLMRALSAVCLRIIEVDAVSCRPRLFDGAHNFAPTPPRVSLRFCCYAEMLGALDPPAPEEGSTRSPA